ncbi:MAG: TIGR03663 family protein [Chloroflexota bacterium]|nr:TIGR03663 family protein [Chloroflexota bacterium]
MTADQPNTNRYMVKRALYVATYVVLAVAAAAIRFWELGSRAFHHDESLHAFYSWNLYNGDGYIHNPMMHGPFQMEATAGLFFLFGDSDDTARLLYAIAGTALVLMPLLFRSRLGNWGALFTSMMLAFSPAMLYYSRFARNDILMAVWALGIVIAMWRYLDEDAKGSEEEPAALETDDEETADPPPKMGKAIYLYITAALLAFAFASKESAYLITGTMGLYLVLVLVSRNWNAVKSKVNVGVDSPPVAALKIVGGWINQLERGLDMRGISKEAGFLVLLITITLPLWGAFVSILQDTPLLDWSGLTLAGPVGGSGPIGSPVGGGLVVAFLVTAFLIFLALSYGLKWNTSVWWKAAAIFYALYILMYTSFFTNGFGIGSGVWQSLGYWVVQQGEGRGSQPWYYYTVITTLYEFLPLLLSVIGSVYYLRNRDKFGMFLVYWVWTTFLLYTIASEKMPWLLVNITLPMIVLSGKFLNDIIVRVEWRKVSVIGGVLTLVGVPLFLALLWNLTFLGLDGSETVAGLQVDVLGMALAVVAIVLVAAGYFLARIIGPAVFATVGLVSIAAILLVLSGRAGLMAAFQHGDIPVEMIVYTQTSPDIHNLARLLREQDTQQDISIAAIDGTSGFHWPWYWYLRGREDIEYTNYGTTGVTNPPTSPVALVHSTNKSTANPSFAEVYSDPQLLRQRWWFPEAVYRGYHFEEDNRRLFGLRKLIADPVDRRTWRELADYFLYRNLWTNNGTCVPAEDDFSCLGSENAYIYQRPDMDTPFVPRYN